MSEPNSHAMGCDREDCGCVPFDWAVAFMEPWSLSVCDDGYPMVHTAGDVICVDEPNHRPGCPWSLARFHMLRSAPELYASLVEISEMLWARPDMMKALRPLMGFAEQATFERAGAVLRKARGEQQP